MTQGFEFITHSLAISGCCFILDALIMAILNLNPRGKRNAERSHFLLSILSIVIYLIAFQGDSESFRTIWMKVITGLYIFDICIIARDWKRLRHSYRVFYTVHHGFSFSLFALWYYTFIPFTSAMALAAILWVSSDVWRWAEQFFRLSGYIRFKHIGNRIWYLERSHRILAYAIYLWVLDFEFKHASELVLLLSGIMMDVIDIYFQRNTPSNDKVNRTKDNREPQAVILIEANKAA